MLKRASDGNPHRLLSKRLLRGAAAAALRAGIACFSLAAPGSGPPGRRPRATGDPGRAVLFHPDPEAGVDDLAARSHGAPHLYDRKAFGEREAVMVRRVHRPL